MSSTNKTTNYELPQFISTDKPTWLGDFNGSMQTIDIQMKANADAAAAAATTANAAATQTDMTTAEANIASLQAGLLDVQTALQKIRIYDGDFITGTVAGNAYHTVNVTRPTTYQTIRAVIPFGYDPSADWSTRLVFDQGNASGSVRFRAIGATNQYYSIKYKVIYTVA